MRLRQFFASVLVVLLSQATIAAGQSAPQSIILATTTSLDNSGLLAKNPAGLHEGHWNNRACPGSRNGAGASDGRARRGRSGSGA